MLEKELIECIECAIPHRCLRKEGDSSKKCAYCEIDYTFIAAEPTLTNCAHQICQECVAKIENSSVKCKICNEELKSLNRVNKAAQLSVKSHLKELTASLHEKFISCTEFYKGRTTKKNTV